MFRECLFFVKLINCESNIVKSQIQLTSASEILQSSVFKLKKGAKSIQKLK